MGRFESTVEFYTRYREPYSPRFFQRVSERIGLRGNESLLDVGCGPGLLALGFAPYVGSCTGVDPEAAMVAAAKAAAAEAGVALRLRQGRIEDFAEAGPFDMVTIGRAIHWMDRERTLAVLERIVSDSGRIVICGASSLETVPWAALYDEVRRSWASHANETNYRLNGREWFANSKFREVDSVEAVTGQQVSIADLIGRALSKSNTSTEVLGERRAEFEAEITAALEPFAQDGMLQEEIVARARIFGRMGR
jgi:SAM-dependent methyltransferase